MNKRDQAEAYILKLMNQLDKTGSNASRYSTLFKEMSNQKFDEFMQALRKGETQLNVQLPNVLTKITTNDVVAVAKSRKVPIFERILFHDSHTKRKYLTKYAMLILNLPVRRLSQYLFHKISLPEGDQKVNPVSGQVIPPDKGAALSAIETQILAGKGLETSVIELVRVRSGDLNAYRSFKHQIEESGEAVLADVPMSPSPRSAVAASRYLHAIGIDSNF